MAYENLCMYCFEDLGGESVCPHCGRDNRAAVPQIQMLPGSLVYHDRFLIGRALGQDATGIVYAAFDTKRENKLRLREYLPRDCAERLNDGSVVPIAGLEDQFEKGLKRLRASVEGVEDPKKRHFFFEENGTAYIAQRKSASGGASSHREDDEEEERGGLKLGWIIGIGAAVVLVAAVVIITLISGALSSGEDVVQLPTIGPNDVWAPEETPTPTPYVSPTFAALVDPEQSWMDYTYSGNVEQEYQNQIGSLRTATPKPTVRPDTPNYSTVSGKSSKEDITKLQERLKKLGWLSSVSGRYDDATVAAVKAFQTYINENVRPAESLSVDGIAGPKTMMWLYGTDQTKPTPAPTPLVTADPDDDLTVDKNSSKTEIRAVQRKLIVLGLMKSGSDDGVYGTTTTSAVKQFQQRVNEIEGFEVLGVTGTVDPQTMAYLNHYVEWWQAMQQATAVPTTAPTPVPTPVATPAPTDIPDKEEDNEVVDASSPKEAVQAVQRMLIQIGLMDEGSDDGIYGSGTVSAVAKFQEWYNQQAGKNVLPVSGTADAQTLGYLEYMAANGLAVRTPAPTEAPTPVPTDIPDEEEDKIVVDRNSPKEAVQAVQRMLIQVGLLQEGSADGVFGNGTAAAVVSFQQFVNATEGSGTLDVTGVCDAATLSYLEQYAEDGVNAAPTQAPSGSVSDLRLSIDGGQSGAEPVAVTGSEIAFQWSAQGDVDSYYLYIEDAEGGSLHQYEAIEYTEGRLSASELVPGEIYTIRIGALPVGGGEEDILWSTAQFYVPSADATEAPAEPTEAPIAGAALSINGAAAGSGVAEVSGDPISFSWSADGDVRSYSVEIAGDDGSVVFGAEDYRNTTGQISLNELKPGVTYTFTVGVNPAGGGETVWSSAQFRLADDAIPTEAPVQTPVPVAAPALSINGSGTSGDSMEVDTETIEFSWSADGDVESYAVRISGSDGSEIFKNANYTGTTGTVRRSELTPGVVYTITVGARPVGGDDASVVWSQATFTVPVPPTEAPAPTPTIAAISEPQINIDGTAYSQDGVAYLTGETAIFSWMASGEVESYTVYLTNSADQRLDLGTTGETSRTVKLSDLAPGVYAITVGAKPAGGSDSDVLWKSMTFGIPSPAPAETEAPETTQEPAAAWPQTLDRNSAADSIQQVQIKLYELGRLSTDGLQPGVLDAATLQAIADFQQQMNERFDAGLTAIDPANPDAVVDTATLQALQAATADMFQQ